MNVFRVVSLSFVRVWLYDVVHAKYNAVMYSQEMNDLDKKLGFLNKRLHEADGTQWKGMFKKNPMW